MCRHLLRYYVDDYPAAEVSEYLAAGLDAGDSCLTLLTPAHRQAVESCMGERGIRFPAANCVVVDTDELLAQLLVDGRLALDRASEMLAPLMKPSGSARRVCAVGDLAPTLVGLGNIDDAVAFEGLVHRLAVAHGAVVLCAYPIRSFGHRADLDGVMRLSAQHSQVEFPAQLWAQALLPPTPQAARAEP
jgi:hypothetical protein